MDFLKIIDETEAGFKTIANLLISHYAIQTHDTLFRMVDLEFYWDSENLGQNAITSGTNQLNYRFFITP